ncbi:MAG: hypothetical protein OEY49_16040, partial [Candidatus Heimdallarchaeota archaeon]|nr:hypothetical protein [Candidatus Heimdallarchaeota archaeon]
MSNSILNQIPKEYHNILNNIPSSEMESFIHSFNITDHIHEYLKVLEAVDRTIQVFSIPSGLWLHLYGRIAFIASKYEELLHLYSLPKYQNNLQILPFVARVYTFQNEFEKAQELCNRVIDSINFEDNINFMNIHTFFEVYFTQALIYVYSRQIQKIDEVIEKLESFSKKYIVKK